MVVMNLKANNLYDFNNFEMDFSYPKKIVGSTLEKEWLKDYPNFRYRRFNIIVGANSTGKTTLGKLFQNIFYLLNKKEISDILEAVNDEDKTSTFEIDLVNKGILYRIICLLPPNAKDENRAEIKLSIRHVELNKDDTYESALKRLMQINEEPLYYVDALEKQLTMGWNFSYPENNYVYYSYKKEDEESYRLLLETILKVFDPSIEKVTINKDMEKCFYIYFRGSNDPLVIENGRKYTSINYMSSGTKYAFSLTDVIWGLKRDMFGFYYLDEQFSFANSEIELAIIAHLSGYDKNDDQIFITTHNTDVLDMDFPVHTFGFLKKTIIEDNQDYIQYINASKYEKRNSASIKNHYRNDCFSVLPDLSPIYTLGDIK